MLLIMHKILFQEIILCGKLIWCRLPHLLQETSLQKRYFSLFSLGEIFTRKDDYPFPRLSLKWILNKLIL